MNRLATAAFCLALALLSYFQFPGHTWLQQDTQIYAPILENLRDHSLLRNDPLVAEPHLGFSLYDEIAIGLRRLTGLGFHEVLAAQQIVTRAFGIAGLLLLAESMGLGWFAAMFAAGVCSLGATIVGPSVLTVEYEPTPRAFAVPLLMFAIGLASKGRYRYAGIAAAVALVYHPPTALPFWCVWVVVARWQAMVPFTVASVTLFVASRFQPETQSFFATLSPALEAIQRIRASYVYISTWPWATIAHHVVVFALLLLAFWRVREKLGLEARAFLLALPAIGLLTMPVSWLLLEHAKWALMPQLQPMRNLLWVTLATQFLAVVAGVRAGRSVEGAAWIAVAFLLSMPDALVLRWVLLACVLAAAAALIPRARLAAAAVAFFVIPIGYPSLHTPDLSALAEWARNNTTKDAVFVFGDAGRKLDPGVFRTEALRAIYVDWKSGGQVNFFSGFGEQWFFRWQQIYNRPIDLLRYDALGIQYAVARKEHRLPRTPEYENATYVVYRCR